MTRSLAKIQEQLTALEGQTQTLWHRLAQTYDQYSQRLAQSLQNQGIYAVYQICTQLYPEPFLKLGFSARHQLQQDIRQAIAAFHGQFLEALQRQGLSLDPSTFPTAEDSPDPNPESREEGPNLTEIKELLQGVLDQEGLSLDVLIPKMLGLETPASPQVIRTPEDLSQWQRQVEKILQRSLVALAMTLNRRLMDAAILPNNLPLRILEMALHAEDERLAPNREKMPHIVNLLIEMAPKEESAEEETEDGEEEDENLASPESQEEPDDEEEDDDDESGDKDDKPRGAIRRLTVLNLRLGDLEFGDGHLSMVRKQLQTHHQDLKTLRQKYHQLRKAQLTAEAELAWRSSWTADSSPTA